jgi:hypothetical protein
METSAAAVMVKFVLEDTVCPLTVTEIRPVVALEGTDTVRVVAVEAVTVATVPLNFTAFEAGVVLNPWPWTVTVVPLNLAVERSSEWPRLFRKRWIG